MLNAMARKREGRNGASGGEEPTHGVLLRMPLSLHDRLRAEAQAQHRSVNAQLVYMVERGLEREAA